ncbi:putative hydrolase [Gordonia hirsuta DSM 44140 = NBRC 16056]|uniref:Putative hydrolase n=1 Tax=Gordonia hirsuta DSM 44140 = NBRC 16056 TaxID=1121927 RepID=L7LDF9_9ACTN|nr:putative hydrolase [Gordonia hirsuta DSM 44140 = NBRC 16056]
MAVERHYEVNVSGVVRVSVVDSGPSAPVATVILLHSWAMSSSVWDEVTIQLERVSPRLRVIAYDCRGHGASDPVDGTLTSLGDDLAAVIERLVPDGPLVLVGHGMGGSAVLSLGLAHRDLVDDRVGGVVLVSTSAEPLVPEERQWRGFRTLSRMNTELLRRGGIPSKPAPVIRRAVRGLYGRDVDRRPVDTTIMQAAHSHPPALSSLLRDLLDVDLSPALEAYAGKPAAVVVGGSDRVVSNQQIRRTAAELLGSRHVLIPGAGHMLPTECPVDLAMVIGGVALEVVGMAGSRTVGAASGRAGDEMAGDR